MAEYKKSCYNCIHCDVCGGIGFCSYHCSDVSMCKYFKDKSLIAKLPCKVGDVLYVVDNAHGVIEVYCNTIEIESNELYINCEDTEEGYYDTYVYTLEDFGKIVFRTREEA